MTQTKYGLWTTYDDSNKIIIGNKTYLACRCECGAIKNVIVKNLKSGTSKNCGCVRSRKTIERNVKHNKRFTREWRIWRAMKTRCTNENQPQYHNYGGRGIQVCKEWSENFMSFYNDMGESPEGYSLDRIDVNGNYCKENCKWSTVSEQLRNKTNNRKINGICITDIDKSLGSKQGMVAKRIKRGWTEKRAITTKSNANQ